MSFEAELKSKYTEVHRRLYPQSPPLPKRYRKPDRNDPFSGLSPQSTDKKIITIPIRTWEIENVAAIPPPITLARILHLVSETEKFSLSDLRSHRKPRHLADARAVYYHLARKLTSKSYPQIAAFLGGRDHTTAMHGSNRVETLRETNPHWQASLDHYEAVLTGKLSTQLTSLDERVVEAAIGD